MSVNRKPERGCFIAIQCMQQKIDNRLKTWFAANEDTNLLTIVKSFHVYCCEIERENELPTFSMVIY